MKNNPTLYWTLATVPLIAALFLLPLYPDQIPAHYGLDGVVNRWGSKYELLITPLTTIGMAAFLAILQRAYAKMESYTPQNQKAFTVASYTFVAVFWALNAFLFYSAFTKTENIYAGPFDMMQLLAVILGVAILCIGNILPKCKQNAMIGIRTTWTLQNEEVWYKTHRLGAKVFVIGGAAIIISNLFVFHALASLVSILAVLAVVTAICVVYSYVVYKKCAEVSG